jgi:hypothetical protein
MHEAGNDSEGCGLFLLENYACPVFVIRSLPSETDSILCQRLYKALPIVDNESEPRINLISWRQEGGIGREDEIVTLIFPRKKHRPDCYFAEGDEKILVSPGALDMGGLIITPREEDFHKITAEHVATILKEVTLSKAELLPIIESLTDAPKRELIPETEEDNNNGAYLSGYEQKEETEVSVGIMSDTKICFNINGKYCAKGITVSGEQEVVLEDGSIRWNGQLYRDLTFRPCIEEKEPIPYFSLHNVTIGLQFHWERQETQSFQGILRLVVHEDKIVAINVLSVEDYLTSVISSEMNADCPIEFMKAAAVISRSWLLAQIQKRKNLGEKTNLFLHLQKQTKR